MAEQWYTHPAFNDSTTEISIAGPHGNIRCPVVERVFCPPEGLRLHKAFRVATPPAQAREMLRRQKIAALQEEAAALGIAVVVPEEAPEAPRIQAASLGAADAPGPDGSDAPAGADPGAVRGAPSRERRPRGARAKRVKR